MAALRVAHPTIPTVLLDLGPSHGERHDWFRIRREAIRFVESTKPIRPAPVAVSA